MKKQNASILILLCVMSLHGYGEAFSSIELAYNPNHIFYSSGQDYIPTPPTSFDVKLMLGFELTKYFTFKGGVDTLFALGVDGYSPYPCFASWWFDGEFKFDFVRIGYRHKSDHTIGNYDRPSFNIPYRSEDEIYLRLDFNL